MALTRSQLKSTATVTVKKTITYNLRPRKVKLVVSHTVSPYNLRPRVSLN